MNWKYCVSTCISVFKNTNLCGKYDFSNDMNCPRALVSYATTTWYCFEQYMYNIERVSAQHCESYYLPGIKWARGYEWKKKFHYSKFWLSRQSEQGQGIEIVWLNKGSAWCSIFKSMRKPVTWYFLHSACAISAQWSKRSL